MKAWERRLGDLGQLLANCSITYLAPEQFRRNTNQFLQTARTVTFIIQKNKATIKDFDAWYKNNVVAPWSTDSLMTWAKDARNVIEKEGDLEMQSSLRASVVFSYFQEDDVVIDTTRRELLQAEIDDIIKRTKAELPHGVADVAVLKVERRWVANSLPDNELIYALTYVYARLYDVCRKLSTHLSDHLPRNLPDPTSLDPVTTDATRSRFVKFAKPGVGRSSTKLVKFDSAYVAPPALVALRAEFDVTPKPTCLADVVQKHAKLATVNFDEHGSHIPMLFLYDRDWNPIDYLSSRFDDQAEKFIFWRNVAQRAGYLKAFALVCACESWLRDMKNHGDRPIRELPIIGEHMQIVGADAVGTELAVSWRIIRPEGGKKPELQRIEPDDVKEQVQQLFFIKPVVAAMKAVHPVA